MADKNISLPTAGELGLSIRFVKRGPGGVTPHKKASAELREWNNSVARFRAETEDMCPPFGMGGDRFLANTLANEFVVMKDRNMVECSKWEHAFLASLPVLKARYVSEGGDLGDLPWPTEEELRSKFYLDIEENGIPNDVDFDFSGIAKEHRERYEREVRETHEKKIRGVIRHCSEQVEKRLSSVVEKMADYKPKDGNIKAQGVFRDSLIGNIKEIAGMLEHWNITKDPEVDSVRRRLLLEIGTVDPKSLREDPHLRKRVKRSAEDLLSRVGSFGQAKD